MRAFWGVGANVGDTLTPVILEYFTKHKAEWVSSLEDNKLLMCGSILEYAKPGDTVLGAGHYKKKPVNLTDVNVLALRGRLSGDAPCYGDPAILLPLMYAPKIKKKHKIGFIPHLWDRNNHLNKIDVTLGWKDFVDEVLSYEKLVSSSLHGFIIAQVYGVPVVWRHDRQVPGAKIKYVDYLTGIDQGIEYAQQGLVERLLDL